MVIPVRASGRVGQPGKVWTSRTRVQLAKAAPLYVDAFATPRLPGWPPLLKSPGCQRPVQHDRIRTGIRIVLSAWRGGIVLSAWTGGTGLSAWSPGFVDYFLKKQPCSPSVQRHPGSLSLKRSRFRQVQTGSGRFRQVRAGQGSKRAGRCHKGNATA
eukprot:353024-Chlamydomonas_euryale.AAC.1